jgi:uncharacterized protein (TIGR02246 family)
MPAKTPEECDALFEKHINAGDLDALTDLYEADAVLIPAPGETASGREAIRAALGAFIEAKPKMKLSVIKSFSAGKDVAVLYNDWHGRFAGPDGEMETGGEAIEIVRRQADGTWRFVFDDPYGRG